MCQPPRKEESREPDKKDNDAQDRTTSDEDRKRRQQKSKYVIHGQACGQSGATCPVRSLGLARMSDFFADVIDLGVCLGQTVANTEGSFAMTRIDRKFKRLNDTGRKAFVAYVMAGDPDFETSLQVVKGLPSAGVDIIELGLPFTDPMADGPTIQLAGQRALDGGQTLTKTLDLARAFRQEDDETPIVMMGYYNPIYSRGVDRFLDEARDAGIDGLIIVDLPPEEDSELCIPAQNAGLNFIRLATPTTDDKRLPTVLQNTSGFVYYVSITGITGSANAVATDVGPEVARIKSATDLPVIVGFGIKTPEDAANIACVADGAVVGSAIVERIGRGESPADVLRFVKSLADGAHSA